MEIQGRTFLVTGGASGLGAADLKGGETSDTIRFVETDVTDERSTQDAVNVTLEFDGLHGAINCAGIAVAEKVLGRDGPHSLGSFTKVVQVNLAGTFNVIRLVAEAMMRNDPSESWERGVIVTTASVAAFDGQIGQAAYSASKGGGVAMTLPIVCDTQ